MKAWRSKELAQKLAILRQSNGISMQITVGEVGRIWALSLYKRQANYKMDQQIVAEALQHLG